MERIEYQNMCDFLEQKFPEFVANSEYDKEEKDLPYIFYASFVRFIEKAITNNDQELINKFLKFINEFYEIPDPDPKAEEMVAVEIFESFITENYRELFDKNLTGKAREAYLLMYNYHNR